MCAIPTPSTLSHFVPHKYSSGHSGFFFFFAKFRTAACTIPWTFARQLADFRESSAESLQTICGKWSVVHTSEAGRLQDCWVMGTLWLWLGIQSLPLFMRTCQPTHSITYLLYLVVVTYHSELVTFRHSIDTNLLPPVLLSWHLYWYPWEDNHLVHPLVYSWSTGLAGLYKRIALCQWISLNTQVAGMLMSAKLI